MKHVIDIGTVQRSRRKEILCYCGAEPKSTYEVLLGGHGVDVEGSEVFYDDNGTTVDWDSGATLYHRGYPVLVCENGDLFTHRAVTEIA